MPNWCQNSLSLVYETKEQRDAIDDMLSGYNDKGGFRSITFEKLIPQPDFGQEEQKKFEEYAVPNWYTWRCENWGTKWDASDPVVNDDKPGVVNCSFDTAWSPPTPWLEKVVKLAEDLGIGVEYSYIELGCGYYGEYINGELVEGKTTEEVFQHFVQNHGADEYF